MLKKRIYIFLLVLLLPLSVFCALFAGQAEKKSAIASGESFANQLRELYSYDSLEAEMVEETKLFEEEFSTARLIVKGSIDNFFGADTVLNNGNGLFVLQFDTQSNAQKALQHYNSLQSVQYAQIDEVVYASDDIIYTAEPVALNGARAASTGKNYYSWGAAQINAEEYNSYLLETIGADNLQERIVAVIDSGIDLNHFMFEGRIESGGQNFSPSVGGVQDNYGHGTHVAGIICDLTLSNVKILPIKVLGDSGFGYTSGIIAGIEYVTSLKSTKPNLVACNISISSKQSVMGNEKYSMFNVALSNAYSKGILTIAATGNEGIDARSVSPANIPNVVAVAAVGMVEGRLARTSWSNYGSCVVLCAPGDNIISAKAGGGTVAMSGTSMASPHVAAVAAMLFSDSTRSYSAASVREVLIANAVDLSGKGFSIYYGYGMVFAQDLVVEQIEHPVVLSQTSTAHTQPFYLSLSCEQPNSVIFYTTDGTVPNYKSSQQYSLPIYVFSTTKIRARAFVLSEGRATMASDEVGITYIFNGQDIAGAFTVNSSGVLTSYNGILQNVTVPTTVLGTTITAIGEYAFAGSEVVEVRLSSSVKAVKNHGFSGVETLEHFFGEGVEEIGDYAFYGCTRLTGFDSYRLPVVKKIGKYAFAYCTALSTVALTDVDLIDDYAFYMGESTKSVLGFVALQKAETIGAYAFYNCLRLSTLMLPKVKTIAGHAFENSGIVSLSLPSAKYLGARAFFNSKDLSIVDAPNALTIGESCFAQSGVAIVDINSAQWILQGAFADCKNLSAIDLSSARFIHTFAFGGCFSLVYLDLPSVEQIFRNAFDSAITLSVVSFSPSIEFIGENCFANTNIQAIYGYSYTSAEVFALNNSISFVSIGASEEVFDYEVVDGQVHINGYNASLVVSELVIPSFINAMPVTRINRNAFTGCQFIQSISSTTIEVIGAGAFKDCTQLNSVYLSGAKYIGTLAFEGCVQLTSAWVQNAQFLFEQAFFNCPQLREFSLIDKQVVVQPQALGFAGDGTVMQDFLLIAQPLSDAEAYAVANGIGFKPIVETIEDFSYSLITNNDVVEIEIYYVNKFLSGNIIIPSTLNGYTVSSIADSAFADCSLIESIGLPDTITRIGERAFYGCSALRSIELKNVKTISKSAFYGCLSLVDFLAPNAAIIEQEALALCGLTTLELPKIETIDLNAFKGTYLTRIVLGRLITQLGASLGLQTQIYGYSGTVAQQYAQLNQLEFVDIGTLAFVADLPDLVQIGRGESLTLAVSVNGYGLSYNWYVSQSPSMSSASHFLSYTNSLTIYGSEYGTLYYHVIVTDWLNENIISTTCAIRVWADDLFTITSSCSANGTISPLGSSYVHSGEDITLLFAPNKGYMVDYVLVDGQKIDLSGASYTFVAVAQDHTIEVVFKIMVFTVVFVDHDGTVLKTQQVEYGGAATAPKAPVRTNTAQYSYTFTGWDKPFNAITSDLTLVAQYNQAVNSYTVTFKNYDGSVLLVQRVEYGAAATAPAAPQKQGDEQFIYVFSGWDLPFEAIVASVEITAVFDQVVQKYAVTFIDGAKIVDTQQVEYGSHIQQLPLLDTYESGGYEYTFLGWYKDAQLTDAFDNTTDTITAATTLYASWSMQEKPTTCACGFIATTTSLPHLFVLLMLLPVALLLLLKRRHTA